MISYYSCHYDTMYSFNRRIFHVGIWTNIIRDSHNIIVLRFTFSLGENIALISDGGEYGLRFDLVFVTDIGCASQSTMQKNNKTRFNDSFYYF